MKFCIVWKEDKSRQNDTIKSLWNSPTQMTLSDKYDFEESFLHFEFSNNTLDLKCVTLSIISTYGSCVEMKRIRHLHISHNTPCLPPSSPRPTLQTKILRNIFFFFISSGYYSFPGRNWKQCMCKILGANKMLYTWEDVELAITHFAPGSSRFQIWRWPAGLKIRTIMSPGKTRRLWEEVAKAACYN